MAMLPVYYHQDCCWNIPENRYGNYEKKLSKMRKTRRGRFLIIRGKFFSLSQNWVGPMFLKCPFKYSPMCEVLNFITSSKIFKIYSETFLEQPW